MTYTKNKYRISPVLAKRSLVLLMLTIIPIALIHETGHILTCVSSGNTFQIKFSIMAFSVHCGGMPSNLFLYYVSGGAFAAVVSLAVGIGLKRYMSVVVTMFTIALSQFVIGGFEAFAHGLYLDNAAYSAIPYIPFFFISLTMFGKDTIENYRFEKEIRYPSLLKSKQVMYSLLIAIGILVVGVDTITTKQALEMFSENIQETNQIAKVLMSNYGFVLIVIVKLIGMSAASFVSMHVGKFEKYRPYVNMSLLVMLTFWIYVAINNMYLIIKYTV